MSDSLQPQSQTQPQPQYQYQQRRQVEERELYSGEPMIMTRHGTMDFMSFEDIDYYFDDDDSSLLYPLEEEMNNRNNNSYDNPYDECPDDETLWNGIFWLEACLAVRRSVVDWFQLNTIMDGVYEEAFRAGILINC